MIENCHSLSLAIVAPNRASIDSPVALLTLTANSMRGRVTPFSHRARERVAHPIWQANIERVRRFALRNWYRG